MEHTHCLVITILQRSIICIEWIAFFRKGRLLKKQPPLFCVTFWSRTERRNKNNLLLFQRFFQVHSFVMIRMFRIGQDFLQQQIEIIFLHGVLRQISHQKVPFDGIC